MSWWKAVYLVIIHLMPSDNNHQPIGYAAFRVQTVTFI